jgi:hypothetical protein
MNLDNVKCFQYFDVPGLPDWVKSEFNHIGRFNYTWLIEDNFKTKQIINRDLWHEKQPVHNQTHARYDPSFWDPEICLPGTIYYRIKEYLETFFLGYGIQIEAISPSVQVNMMQNAHKYSTTAAHADLERPASISMLLDKGGNDVVTKWYNVVQDEVVDYPHCYPAEELIGPIHEERIQPGRWHYFNAELPHSIHGIESYRQMLNIQVRATHEELLTRLPLA